MPSEEFNLPVRLEQRGSPAPHAAEQQHGGSETARTPLGAHDSELVTAGHVVAHYATTPATAPKALHRLACATAGQVGKSTEIQLF